MALVIEGDASLQLELKPCSIESLKETIQLRCGIPVKQQLLSCDGHLLGPGPLGDVDGPLHLTSFSTLVQRSALRLPCTELRGIQLEQLKQLAKFLEWRCSPKLPWRDPSGALLGLEELNLYHLADWVIRPATTEDQCSYVELIALDAGAQKPWWFVSHAWQETICDFVCCLQGHSQVRELQEDVAYWVCAYANNQHELGQDLCFNPRETSFFRAMQLCKGVLLILDQEASSFHRVWCCFELAMALTGHGEGEPRPSRLLLDIATARNLGEAAVLTDGLTPQERRNEDCVCAGTGGKQKAKREEGFPIELVQKALEIDIAEAGASREVDRIRILNSIAGLPEEELDAALPEPLPPARKECYERLNRSLRCIFALASVSQVISKDLKHLMPAICRALREDSARRSVRLSFANSLKLRDHDLQSLARALPAGLTELLRLDLRSCHGLSNTSVLELAEAIRGMSRLQGLFLDFYMCPSLTDLSIQAIFTASQGLEMMQELDLNLRGLVKVTSKVLVPLMTALQRMPLRKLHLNLAETKQTAEATEELMKALKHLDLRILKLYFTNCPLVGDGAASALGSSLQHKSLKEGILCFSGTALTDVGMQQLSKGLGLLPEMSRLTLRFRMCHHLTEASLRVLGRQMARLQVEKLVIEFNKCRKLPKHLARRHTGGLDKGLWAHEAEEVVQLLRPRSEEVLWAVLKALEPKLSRETYQQLWMLAEAQEVESFLRWLLDVPSP